MSLERYIFCHIFYFRWSCQDPPIPRNGKAAFESFDLDNMKFAYGSTITISCKDGYWIESQHRYEFKLYCNENLQWELKLLHELRDENEEKYIRDEKSNSRDIFGGIGCDRIKCRQPPALFGLEMLNQTGMSYSSTLFDHFKKNIFGFSW